MRKGANGFVVDTSSMKILDLGTEFGVRTGPDSRDMVQVFDGKVLASSKDTRNQRELSAGEGAVVDDSGRLLEKNGLENLFVRRIPSRKLGKTSGEENFNDRSFGTGRSAQVQEGTGLIKEIRAPAHVTAGEIATIEVIPSSGNSDTLWLVFSVDSERPVSYRHISHDKAPPKVAEGETAPQNVPARGIEISLPKDRPFPLHVWVEMWGGGCHVRDDNGYRGKEGGWVNAVSRRANDWGWSKVTVIAPGESIEKVNCFVPPQVSGLIRSAMLTADDDFLPGSGIGNPAVFRWQTNPSSVGHHTLRVCVLDVKSKKRETRSVTVQVSKKEEQSAALPKGNVSYVDLRPVANVPLFPEDPGLRIVDDELKSRDTFDCLGFRFPLRQQGPSVVAVAFQSDPRAPSKVDVPQGEDLLKTVPSTLSESVDIPVDLKGRYVSFLHGVHGGGKLMEPLFEYRVEYDDGKVASVPIREGERVGGYLNDYTTTKAVRVHYGLIGNVSAGIFLCELGNPRPDHKIVKISMRAKARGVAFVLGIAAYDQPIGINSQEVSAPKTVQVTADYTASLGPIKRGLFSINDHGLNFTSKSLAAMAELGPPTVRSWCGLHPPKTNRFKRFEPAKDLADEEIRKSYPDYVEKLEKTARQYQAFAANTNIPFFFTIAHFDFGSKGELLDDPVLVKAYVAWYTDVLKWMWNDLGIQTPYVALFNENGIGKPVELRHKMYRFFNALADSIRAVNPAVKIGGMSECWPDQAIISEFIQTCGTHADFVSWNFYPTGSPEAPSFAELMQRTDRYAVFSSNIRKANKELLPTHPLEQAISEYNMNYNAWKPVDYRLHKGYGAVWTFSVLNNLLYKGSVDLAYYWHFVGGAYGVVAFDGFYPVGTLFHLLNTRAGQGQLCLAKSSDESRVECLAVTTPDEYVLALVNKTPEPQTVELQLLNYFPIRELELTTYSTEEWTVAAKDDVFSLRKLRTQKSRDQTVVLPPFSLRILFIHNKSLKALKP